MLKIGLIGYGGMGHVHQQCYTALPDAEVTAVADVDPAKRDEAKDKLRAETYEDAEVMLASADIDAVDICVPTFLHEKYVVAAVQRGKPIMCEKPMSLSVESCDRMIEAVEKSGVTLMMAQVIRFLPEYMVISDLVKSGKYGKVLWANASRLSLPPLWAWENWYMDPARSGGGILDLHIHDVDFLLHILGLPKVVDARGAIGQGGGVDTVLSLASGYANGATSYAEGSLMLPVPWGFVMSLFLTLEKGAIKYNGSASPTLMVYPPEGDPFAPEIPEVEAMDGAESGINVKALGAYYNEIRYFVDCVKAGTKPARITPREAREAVRICLAERQSVETGKPVEV